MPKIYCLTCDNEFEESESNEFVFDYDLFCENVKGEAKAQICDHCASETNNPNKHLALELIATVRIFRMNYPESIVTPKPKKDKPKEDK